ncbi:MAG: hypothetical protein K6F34_05420 [Lachnospiraceae bacterium]|nr:hypothetical protein [Lachnospiraceae bacterium]
MKRFKLLCAAVAAAVLLASCAPLAEADGLSLPNTVNININHVPSRGADDGMADVDDTVAEAAGEDVAAEDEEDNASEAVPDITLELEEEIPKPPAMKKPSGNEALRTLMIYMVGSDLESGNDKSPGGYATADIKEMLDATIPDGVNVVLECGGANDWQNNLIPDGEVTRYAIDNEGIYEVQKLGRTTMTSEGDLSDFIKFASAKYPAANYTLVLWDHGGGAPVGFGMDQLGKGFRDSEGNTFGWMYDYEIKRELDKAGVDFDAVIFDACNMCTLEMGMSLGAHATYMVGAESTVSGIGMNYTQLLELLDREPQKLCEKAAQGYMAAIHEYKAVSSISVIRIDYIERLYAAYSNYISSIAASVKKTEGYEEYVRARSNSMTVAGEYKGSDSIDLQTLAINLYTDASPALINWVNNAVVYTDSDYPFGHGLLVYSPFDAFYAYEDGRESMVGLGYDKNVIAFYDNLMSRRLAHEGEEVVSQYGGSWYIESYEEVAETEAAEMESEAAVETAGDDETDEYNETATYTLEAKKTENGYYAVSLSNDAWDLIDHVELTLMFTDEINGEELLILMGRDYNCSVDGKNRLALVNPTEWFSINGYTVPFYATMMHEDPGTGEVAKFGRIPVLINGSEAFIYLYYDDAHKDGVILGYCFGDITSGEDEDTAYYLEDSDEIELLLEYMDEKGNWDYDTYGDVYKAKDLKLKRSRAPFDNLDTYGRYIVYDIYGNTYMTEACPLGKSGSVK